MSIPKTKYSEIGEFKDKDGSTTIKLTNKGHGGNMSTDHIATCDDTGGLSPDLVDKDSKLFKETVMRISQKRMTRHSKGKTDRNNNFYQFYNCKCGWGTGPKYNERTYKMLIRLHKRRCDGCMDEKMMEKKFATALASGLSWNPCIKIKE